MRVLMSFAIGSLTGWLIGRWLNQNFWQRQYIELRREYELLDEELSNLQPPTKGPSRPVRRAPDDLQVIKGIGPVISELLNNAGVNTYAGLAALTAAQLRQIVGERLQGLTDEESILAQARALVP